MRKLTPGEHAMADADMNAGVDTDWAQTCFLLVMKETGTTRAYVVHLVANLHEDEIERQLVAMGLLKECDKSEVILGKILDLMKAAFENLEGITVRGGAIYFDKNADPATFSDAEKFAQSMLLQRKRLLALLAAADIPPEKMDVCWGEGNTEVRIVYNGKDGTMKEDVRAIESIAP